MKQKRMTQQLVASGMLLIVFSAVAALFWNSPDTIVNSLGEHSRLTGAAIFAAVMCIATVVAPIAVLPLVPIVALILGPLTTGAASMVGWTAGAVIAFLIARHAARPLVHRFVPLETISTYEKRIPAKAHFLTLVFLRMLFPVDVLSYAIGLVSTVSLKEYTLTTLIGVSWFSFAFAYGGEALYSRNYVLLGSIGVASVVALSVAFLYIQNERRGER